MAHWAEIDQNNVVLRVTVGDNNDPAGDEGYQWLIDNLGGRWVKTSYNSRGGVHYTQNDEGLKVSSGKPHLRYNYAGIGYIYDEQRDAFIPPKPDDFTDKEGNSFSFTLNEETCLWEAVSI